MSPSNLVQIGLLCAEALAAAAIFVGLFRLRRWLGYAPLYVTIGALQFFQGLLSLSFYVPVGGGLTLSPGSTVLLPLTVFAVLLIYIAEDAPEARRLVYSVLLANVALSLLSAMYAGHVGVGGVEGPLAARPDVFLMQPRVMVVGTLVLLADVILVILAYEAVSRWVRPIAARMFLAAAAVLAFDTLAFVFGALWGSPGQGQLIASGLVGKTAAALLYSGVFATFLRRGGAELADRRADPGDIHDVFRALTYRQRYEEARKLVYRDPLTGLFNRRHFRETLERECDRSRRYGARVALLLLDVDHFKAVNDRYGHQVGDDVLRTVAERLQHTIRASDVACRIGGEEFAVLAPNADEETAVRLGDRIREAVRRAVADSEALPLDHLTLTVGVAVLPGDHPGSGKSVPDALVSAADRRLYAGKNEGRNRTVGRAAEVA